jgi:hypothetical protein
MKKLYFLLMVVILLSSYSFAQDSKGLFLKYDLEESIANVFVEVSPLDNETFELKLPIDSTEINANEHFIQKTYKEYILLIFNDSKGQDISVSYITKAVIESNKNSFFILDLLTFKAQNISLEVTLPKEATLKYSLESPKPSIFPFTDKIKTNGQKITLFWDDELLKDKETVLVIYKINQNSRGLLIIFGIISFSLLIFLFVLAKKIPKKNLPLKIRSDRNSSSSVLLNDSLMDQEPFQLANDLTKNLFEDEKQIILILLESKDKELWQKELQQKLGISKVKLSRRLRNLKQKGLIEGIPYGNTNKIRLIIN